MDPYEVREYPEKSWSISKMKTLENCYREYYYTYYGSHNGWISNAPMENKVSWRLKKLTNMWLMFGDKLHLTLKKSLTNFNNPCVNEEYLKKYLRDLLNYQVKESKLKSLDRSWDDYPKGEMLQEFYYNEGLNETTIIKIKERIEASISNFFTCKSLEEVLNEKTKVLEIDEGKFDYIIIHGVKVFSLIDLLYINENGKYTIVDWKTGNPSDFDKEQLLVYALYVMEKYSVPIENIQGRMEYLSLGEESEFIFTYEDLKEILQKIENELKVINAFLEDEYENKPKDKIYFRKCNNNSKCSRCKFRKLCSCEEE